MLNIAKEGDNFAIQRLSARKLSTSLSAAAYLVSSVFRFSFRRGLVSSLPLLLTLVMFVVGPPTFKFGSPTTLDPNVPLGDEDLPFGCSVVPVPDIIPTGFPMNDEFYFIEF